MFSYLVENVVINAQDATAYAERMAKSVNAPEAKAWFAKKLRAFILNSPDVLQKVSPNEITKDMPPYVLAAAEKNEPIFSFSSTSPNFITKATDRIEHIKDFFDSLWEVKSQTPNPENPVEVEHHRVAEKILSKLQKMNLEQVEAAHELWNTRSTKQVGNLSKEGCEVTYTFSNGFYWVRYTDADTMRRDGKELQNCLGQGNYWSQVEDGSQAVYGLRKPNDEAVVGVRVLLRSGGYYEKASSYPAIAECKGKNNKPAAADYIPYIVALLKQLDIRNENQDLKNAGIFINNGKYGSFEDIADTIYDQDGVKIMQVENNDGSRKVLLRAKRRQFWATVRDEGEKTGQIDILTGISEVPAGAITAALNALDLPASRSALIALAEMGIFPSDKHGYGTIDEVGQTVWTGMTEEDRAVSTLKNGSGYLFVFRNDKPVRLEVQRNIINALPREANTAFIRFAIPALTAAKVKFSTNLEMNELWGVGLVQTNDGIKPVDEVSKVVSTIEIGRDINPVKLLEVVAKKSINANLIFMAHQYSNGALGEFIVAVIYKNKKMDIIGTMPPQPAVVQFIVDRYAVSNLARNGSSEAQPYGLFGTDGDNYVSSLDAVMKLIRDPSSEAKFTRLCKIKDFAANLSYAFAQRKDNNFLPEDIQKKIFMALKPSKSELLKTFEETKDRSGMTIKKVAAADQLIACERYLPAFRDQIDAIKKALELAAKMMVSRDGDHTMYGMPSNFGNRYGAQPYERVLINANEQAKKFITDKNNERYRSQREDPNEVADDQFAAMNLSRRFR